VITTSMIEVQLMPANSGYQLFIGLDGRSKQNNHSLDKPCVEAKPLIVAATAWPEWATMGNSSPAALYSLNPPSATKYSSPTAALPCCGWLARQTNQSAPLPSHS
jgi:hypothetical protein